MPLFLHGSFRSGARFQRHRTSDPLGQTVEETIAGPTLGYGGVLDRFPGLKLVLAHGGGATTFQIGRYLTPPGREERTIFGSPAGGSFLDGYRKLHFDGTLYTREALELLIPTVGADRVLFGTESPGRGTFLYEGRQFDDLRPVVESIEGVSAEDRARILEENARSVFNLTS